MADSKQKIYYVYLDYTLEEKPRVFYVGKGNKNRISHKERNIVWKRIASKYGWRREIILCTKDESCAFEIEQEHIKLYKTFVSDWEDGSGWGANLTRGGEGKSGALHSEETKRKISAAITGERNPFFGKKHSPESLLKISNAASKQIGKLNPFFGKHHSDDAKFAISSANTGNVHTQEWKDSMSKRMSGTNNPMYGKTGADSPNYGKQMSEETKLKLKRANGSGKHPTAKLSMNDISIIREKYATKLFTQLQLAREYGVGKSTIQRIVNFETYIV